MVTFKAGVSSTIVVNKAIDERVNVIVDRKLTKEQRIAGVVAKISIKHPAFRCTVTAWKKKDAYDKDRYWINAPSQEGKKNSWFPLVQLNEEVVNYLLDLVKNPKADTSAYYLKALGPSPYVTSTEATNETLGIENIIIDGRLTPAQLSADILCKVNIITTIGILCNYTVFASKFGRSLYGNAPSSGKIKIEDDGKRGTPGYTLSDNGLNQVMNFLHPQVDFSKANEYAGIPEEEEDTIVDSEETPVVEGFEAVGEAMFNADTEV